jgi:protein-S-isoprenylcysteine O-methyltransferase Ste14
MNVPMPDLRDLFFRYRSYTPVPLVLLMLAFARPTLLSFAIGLPVALAGELIRLWGVSIAGSETRVTGGVGASRLITSGPFSFVRNPLYLGNILIYLGLGVASMALFPWLQVTALLFFMFQYRSIVSLEEDFLTEKFGEEYLMYRDAVPRFLPGGRRFAGDSSEQPEVSWARGVKSDRRTLQAIGLLTAALILIGTLR